MIDGPDALLSRPIRLGDLAASLGLRVEGDVDCRIRAPATLASAEADSISFLSNPAYRAQLRSTRAGAVIVAEDALADCPTSALVAPDPYTAWARALELFHPPPPIAPGIDASAQIHPGAQIDDAVEIGPNCSVGPGARIGAGVRIGAGCVIETDAFIDTGTRLVANVFVGERVRIGKRVIAHPGVVIGADGFGLAMDQGHWRKVPQIGSVVIGDDCEIGANTTIDRGAIDDTVLGVDVRLDNQVQIAHNVIIGDHTAIAGCTGIAGSTRIGRYCMIAGACGIGGHLEICDRVIITAMSTVLHSITEPGSYGSGIPARPMRAWKRTLVRLGQLDSLFKRRRNGSD